MRAYDLTEPTREDAELALLRCVTDDRLEGLTGQQMAIGMLHVLAEDGWLLLPKAAADTSLAVAAREDQAWQAGFRQGVEFGRLRYGI
jgi:hypothetical protein